MAKEIRIVRFKLSELLKAVQRAQRQHVKPAVSEALQFYMNWALARGWTLKAVTNQMDPQSLVVSLERTPQLEMRNEEFWNVIWEADGATETCDLLEAFPIEPLSERMLKVQEELKLRGWTSGLCDRFERDGFLPIHAMDIYQAVGEELLSVAQIVDSLEEKARAL